MDRPAKQTKNQKKKKKIELEMGGERWPLAKKKVQQKSMLESTKIKP